MSNGALCALVSGQRFLAHREAGDIIHTYAALIRPVEWFSEIDFADAIAAKACVAAESGQAIAPHTMQPRHAASSHYSLTLSSLFMPSQSSAYRMRNSKTASATHTAAAVHGAMME